VRVLIGPNHVHLERVIEELATKYPDHEFVYCPDRAKLAEELPSAHVFFGFLTRDEFLSAGELHWIQSPSTGNDRFLTIPELVEGDVILTSARGTHAICLAEHTFALLLSFTRGIRQFIFEQQRHHWANREWRNTLVELTGSTLGIVGFGTVGRATAHRARAFGMRIVAVDVVEQEKPDYVEWLGGLNRLGDLLSESDYVVVTVPYTQDTRGMLGREELAIMKPTAILVGISRGGIIDEDALVDALRSGRLAGAGLDVTAQEPLPEDSPLWDTPNLLITPHVAGGTQFEADAVLEIFTENLDRFLRGELPLRNQIDKRRGF